MEAFQGHAANPFGPGASPRSDGPSDIFVDYDPFATFCRVVRGPALVLVLLGGATLMPLRSAASPSPDRVLLPASKPALPSGARLSGPVPGGTDCPGAGCAEVPDPSALAEFVTAVSRRAHPSSTTTWPVGSSPRCSGLERQPSIRSDPGWPDRVSRWVPSLRTACSCRRVVRPVRSNLRSRPRCPRCIWRPG